MERPSELASGSFAGRVQTGRANNRGASSCSAEALSGSRRSTRILRRRLIGLQVILQDPFLQGNNGANLKWIIMKYPQEMWAVIPVTESHRPILCDTRETPLKVSDPFGTTERGISEHNSGKDNLQNYRNETAFFCVRGSTKDLARIKRRLAPLPPRLSSMPWSKHPVMGGMVRVSFAKTDRAQIRR